MFKVKTDLYRAKMHNLGKSENKYQTDPQSNQKIQHKNCYKFFKWVFCFYNLSLLVSWTVVTVCGERETLKMLSSV